MFAFLRLKKKEHVIPNVANLASESTHHACMNNKVGLEPQ